MQLHVVASELPPEAPVRPRLARVQTLIREVIDEGRNALRGLRQEESAEDLESALARVPGELAVERKIDFRILAQGARRELRPGLWDEVYRVAREALRNAFRHSGAGRIEVEIEYGARTLRVRVRDDGGGLGDEVRRSGRERHFGLSGMRERAEGLGGRLEIWSRAGLGTEVELTVPAVIAYRPHPGGPAARWHRWRRRRGREA
jgi:signal transduction histidine kinase